MTYIIGQIKAILSKGIELRMTSESEPNGSRYVYRGITEAMVSVEIKVEHVITIGNEKFLGKWAVDICLDQINVSSDRDISPSLAWEIVGMINCHLLGQAEEHMTSIYEHWDTITKRF